MALENKTGNAQLEGNAVIIDSAGGYTIIANQVFMNKKKNSFLATRKPVLIIKQKNDSTYIAADTIYSGFNTFVKNKNKVLQNDSTINVDTSENRKVEETISSDTMEQFFLKQHQQAIDSIKNGSQKDTSEIFKERNVIKENLLVPKKDSSHLILKKPVDSSLIVGGADSAHHALPRLVSPPTSDNDSAQKVTPQVSRRRKKFKEKVIIPRKDTSQLLLKKLPIDSSAIKNSMYKEIDSTIISDSIKNKIFTDSTFADSLRTDSTKKLTEPLPDSLKAESKHINDSTNKSDTAIRYFLAFHHVKIFNDSLQSVCDSMFISSKDSVFRLYYNPVVWSGNTQINGDTIYLYTKNKQPARLYVFESGLIVNETKEGFFNQMSGKTINGYFINGKIDYMRVKGTQAESIYYIQNEDSAYIGMNRATGDVIDLYFEHDDLKKILFINAVKGTVYPMDQIPEDQKKLKIFKWLDSERPKNRAELFE